jgi:hypothetical protein
MSGSSKVEMSAFSGSSWVRERAGEILDERTAQMAELTQGFRNLIHPGKELRDTEEPSRQMARMASAALTYVVRRVATWTREAAERPPSD